MHTAVAPLEKTSWKYESREKQILLKDKYWCSFYEVKVCPIKF